MPALRIDPGGDLAGEEGFAAAGEVAAPVLAAVGEVGGPGELVEFLLVEFLMFGGEIVGDLEAHATAGGGEFAVGGAEDAGAPAEDEVVFAGDIRL